MTGQLLGSSGTAFYAGCALLLLAVAVVAVVLKPALALWALAVLFLTEDATQLPLDTSLVKTGTTHIYPADAVAVMLLLATAIYLIRQPPPARIMFPLAVAGVMFTVNLALGVATFGLQHAVNESRQWLYLLTATAFVIAVGSLDSPVLAAVVRACPRHDRPGLAGGGETWRALGHIPNRRQWPAG